MIKKDQYCFENISATIVMKFYVVVKYYLVNLGFKFCKDQCINARARVVNTRMHVLSHVRVFTTRAHAFVQRSSCNLKLKLSR